MKYRRRCAQLIASVAIVTGLVQGVPTVALAASWDPVSSDCHNGGVSGSSVYTWCWSKKKRINDNTPTSDVYAFRMTLAGNAVDSDDYLNRLWVEIDPRDSSPGMAWYSADPFKPDDAIESSSDCKTWTWSIGVSSGITAAFSESGTVCARTIYTPKLYSERGHHAGVLNKSNCWGGGVVKKVAASVLVRTAQNRVPLWDTSKHGMYVRNTRDRCTDY